MNINSFDHINFEPLTLIYLIKNDQVLLLRRNASKQVLPNLLLGLGGKVDDGESFEVCAKREVKEESGFQLEEITYKGIFCYVDLELQNGGIIYLYTSEKFSGEQMSQTPEGTLEWHDIDTLIEVENMARHQFEYLPDILYDSDFHFEKTFVYQENELIQVIDGVPQH